MAMGWGGKTLLVKKTSVNEETLERADKCPEPETNQQKDKNTRNNS